MSAAPVPPDGEPNAAEVLSLIYVTLTGAEPMWAEMPADERCARAANEAQQAFLAIEAAAAGRAAATPDAAADEFTEAAWGLIASAYGGNWSDAPDDWHGAAARWRDEYVAGAIARPPAASPDDQPVMANMCEGESPDHKPGITAAATPEAPDEEGWSPGIDDPQPPALGDLDTGEGWYQT